MKKIGALFFIGIMAISWHSMMQVDSEKAVPYFYNNLQNALKKFFIAYDSSETSIRVPNYKDAQVFNLWLKAYLIEKKYLNQGDTSASSIKSALIRFQQLNGLEPDGIVGNKTLAALKITGKARYQKIMLNVKRWQADPIKDSLYVFINIPSCTFYLIENNSVKIRFKTIVGKRSWKTPVLKSNIMALVVNPFWYVPRSIAVKEILPDVKRDVNYLQRNNMRVLNSKNQQVDYYQINWHALNADNFNYTIRQEPGPDNALGMLKFIFPSPYDIYMHDTPSKSLFNQSKRTLSHGCIRLEKPMELVSFLSQHGFIETSTDSIIKWSTYVKNYKVNFKKPLPIHVGYYTSEADPFENIYFFEDVYGKDEDLRKFLFQQ
jgi:murein L,D-transpeptidase YcbB/YkuD